jgi:hypothetical protein
MGDFIFFVIIAVVFIVVVVKKAKREEVEKGYIEELKNSNNYAFALNIYESLEKENRKEPIIDFNYEHNHLAYAEFSTIIKEAGNSMLYIHTTCFGYQHKYRANYLVRRGYCVLDMGMTLVYSENNSQEMINLLKGLVLSYSPVNNLYVRGKLLVRGSDSLPIYPMVIPESAYND